MGRLVGRQHRRAMALALVAGLAVVAAVVATRPFGPPPPDRRNCDGVSAEAGGCDPDQPRFTATTCEGVGREFGIELNRRALPDHQRPGCRVRWRWEPGGTAARPHRARREQSQPVPARPWNGGRL